MRILTLFGITAASALLAGTAAPTAQDCSPVGNVQFVCGLVGPEDLVSVPGSDWVIASGRKQIARRERQAGAAGDDTVRLAGLYQISMIIRLALLEGATFFQLIIFHLEGLQVSLVLAIVLLAGIILLFPTRSRVESWIDKQQEKLDEERWT